MIEDGQGTLSIGDIGRSIMTLEGLRQAFDNLDVTPDNVSFTFAGGVLRFDFQVTKDLDGRAKVHIADSSIELNGEAEVEAQVALHLVLGVDSKGFSSTLAATPIPKSSFPIFASMVWRPTGDLVSSM